MEKIYDLVPDYKDWLVRVEEKNFFHSAHAYCQTCGRKMKFELREHSPRYSGYTGNVVVDLMEVCLKGCEEFETLSTYRNQIDGKLYVKNFIKLDEYIEHLLNKKETEWNKKF